MWLNPQEIADFVIFTEKILNGKLHFLCSAIFKSFLFIIKRYVNISFNNEQKHTTDSVTKEQINGFKKRQQRRGAIISVLIFLCQFSLFGLIFWKIYLSWIPWLMLLKALFQIFSQYSYFTPLQIIEITFGFLTFSGTMKRK